MVDREDGWGEDVGGWWGVHSRSWESLGQIRRGWVFHSLSWESAGVRDGGGGSGGGGGRVGRHWCSRFCMVQGLHMGVACGGRVTGGRCRAD